MHLHFRRAAAAMLAAAALTPAATLAATTAATPVDAAASPGPTAAPDARATRRVAEAPEPTILARPPAIRGTLPWGTPYVVQPLAGGGVVAEQLWFRAPSAGFGATPAPSTAWFAAEGVAATAADDGQTLSRRVQDVGGRFTVEVFPQAVHVALVVPTWYAPTALAALTRAYFSGRVSEDGLKRAAPDVATQALVARLDPLQRAVDAATTARFADGPDATPALDAAGFGRVTFAAAGAYARRAFRATNAVVVVAGDVAPALLTAIETPEQPGAGPEPALPSTPTAVAVSRTLEGGLPGYGAVWAGPPIADERAATALDFVADYLFNERDGMLARRLAGAYPEVDFVGQYVTYGAPGVLVAALSGPGAERAAPLLDAAVAGMATPLSPAVFAAARAAYLARLEATVAEPAELASSLGWYHVEGAPLYAPGEAGEAGCYFAVARALTAADVAAAARAYLASPPARVRVLTPVGKKAST